MDRVKEKRTEFKDTMFALDYALKHYAGVFEELSQRKTPHCSEGIKGG